MNPCATQDAAPTGGDRDAQQRLLARYYQEFRQIARRVLRDDGAKLALQPTDLAHEAAMRVLKLDDIDWRDATHFLAVSARVIRQTLIDEVRRARAGKRQPVEAMTQWPGGSGRRGLSLERLDDALNQLFEIDADRARVVEMRFFVGLSLPEIAGVLGISESTVTRRWRGARAWLLASVADDA